MSEVQYEQNLRDLALIRTDPAWALTAVQEWRRLKAENERLREALRRALTHNHEVVEGCPGCLERVRAIRP